MRFCIINVQEDAGTHTHTYPLSVVCQQERHGSLAADKEMKWSEGRERGRERGGGG